MANEGEFLTTWVECGTALDQTSVDAYDIAYAAATTGHQYFGNKTANAIKVPEWASNAMFTFLLMDTTTSADGADAALTVWIWHVNGPAWPLFTADLVAGTASMDTNPVSGVAFTATDFWAYADTITVGSNYWDGVYQAGPANGIARVVGDMRAPTWLLADFDCNASTAGAKRAENAIGNVLFTH